MGAALIDNMFVQFINTGNERFYIDVLERSRQRMHNCNGVDLELLHLSYAALERARLVEKETGKERLDEWRNLAYILRRAAHKIYRECPKQSSHSDFLRAV